MNVIGAQVMQRSGVENGNYIRINAAYFSTCRLEEPLNGSLYTSSPQTKHIFPRSYYPRYKELRAVLERMPPTLVQETPRRAKYCIQSLNRISTG